MAKTYKVWIQIEAYDDELDEYSDDTGDLPECLGTFDTLDEAHAFINEHVDIQ